MRMGACTIAALAGCSAMATVKTARTVPEGRTHYLAALELNGGGPVDDPAEILPEAAIGVRHGVSERVELGAMVRSLPLGRRVTTAGGELEVKVQVCRDASGTFDVALGPAAGARWIASGEVAYATLPILFGWNLENDATQLVVAPEVGLQRWSSPGADPILARVLGLSLGLVIRTGPRTAIVPEIAIHHTPVGVERSPGSLLVHLGFGFLYR